MTSPSDAWSPSDTTPIIQSKTDNSMSIISNRKPQSAWDDTEFESIDENSSIGKQLDFLLTILFSYRFGLNVASMFCAIPDRFLTAKITHATASQGLT